MRDYDVLCVVHRDRMGRWWREAAAAWPCTEMPTEIRRAVPRLRASLAVPIEEYSALGTRPARGLSEDEVADLIRWPIEPASGVAATGAAPR